MVISEGTKVSFKLGGLLVGIAAIVRGALWLQSMKNDVNGLQEQAQILPKVQADLSQVKEDVAFIKGIMERDKSLTQR